MRYLHEKGIKVNHTEQIAKSASTPKTGPCATLRVFLRGCGSGAPATRRLVLTCAVALGVTLALASSALAARGHVFSKSFGEPCMLEPCGEGKLKDPSGVAVNEASHDVYVADQGNNRVERFSSAGAYIGLFDGSGTNPGEGSPAPTGQFSHPGTIAVDNSCHLQHLSGAACTAADPSNEDVYVVASSDTEAPAADRVVDKFTASGEYIGQITAETAGITFKSEGKIFFLQVAGVAVDPHGQLWIYEAHYNRFINGGNNSSVFVDNFTNAVANQLSKSRDLHTEQPMPGIAADSVDNFYLNYSVVNFPLPGTGSIPGTGLIFKFNSEGEELSGEYKNEIDPEPASGVAVESTSGDVYIDNVTSVRRFSPSGSPLESLAVPGAHGSGIGVDSATGDVYVTDSSADVVDLYTLEPPGAPTVGSESVSDVTTGSATFSAEVNPRSEPNEQPTSYRFEYLTQAEFEANGGSFSGPDPAAATPVPDGTLAANYEPDTVTAHLQALQSRTVYHFRVVAHNRHPGAAEGEELVFTTQATGVFALPDARQWEMVSPPNKHGASIVGIREAGAIQAAAEGGAITYEGNEPIEAEPPSNSNSPQVLSTRGSAGWSSHEIAPPHEGAAGVGVTFGGEYRYFSMDLSRGILQPFGAFVPSLSPEASEQTLFLRNDFPAGDPAEPCTTSCYRPVLTNAAGFADVPSGAEFGEEGSCSGVTHKRLYCGPEFRGASPDLSHVVFSAVASLIEGAPAGKPGTTSGSDDGSLYEYSADSSPAQALQLVSVLPDGTDAPDSSTPQVGSNYLAGSGNANVARNAVSLDGSRVVWSTGSRVNGVALYLRDLTKGVTLRLDAVVSGKGGGRPEPVFQTASTDDSKVFFHRHATSDQRRGCTRVDIATDRSTGSVRV